MSEQATREVVEAVWRLESTRLIAGLVRIVRDVGLAEDVAQDAMVAALDQWPRTGLPDNPAAWLMTAAKRRAVDHFRRGERRTELYAEIAHQRQPEIGVDQVTQAEDHIDDDVLRLMFLCCHPRLTPEAQTTLTLRLVAGLSTSEIARAYLARETTVAQRVVRAKRTLAQAGAAMDEPDAAERSARLTAVLRVIYLLFNEGYSATSGPDWTRPELCTEAVRISRMVAALAPAEAEVHGLRALLELQSSRLAARIGPDGEPVLLTDQDRRRWDPAHMMRGFTALAGTHSLAQSPGPYALQAEIAACHARARTTEETDWVRIAGVYEQLARLTGSAVVELNRAVALGMAYGPEQGLVLIDQLVDLPVLRDYHLLPSVRGDLLARLGRHAEARTEFARAAALTQNERERTLLLGRADHSC